MPKYAVQMARTSWLTIYVEADDEEGAVEAAHDESPPLTAREAGWGSFGKWSVDADDWVPIDQFFIGPYDRSSDGPVVRLAKGGEGEE